ncbi:TonB-dependent receptor [Fulvivirga ulvae]|uniref:TonB-dependent receptor n=1 Tax=Fulvivirga ulvae TaxID=2904245 RepID=UPI001F15C05F|nr:TonB-dependent receptor [Fulvivirga ulvae]UII32687.1 TonB-dependent receptor [Fulvivirga ulvae]
MTTQLHKCIMVILLSFGIIGMSCAQFSVSGIVKDIEGEPLVGVNIVEKGTGNGTITDLNGKYALQAGSDQAVLQFSFIGFDTEEVFIDGKSIVDVVMLPNLTQLMEIEIVGSRSLNRSATETPVPVDIIPLSEVATTSGQLDVNQMLQYVAPSYNANRQSGADGSDHIDPATIRGLGPDQTLVLVNGKRRHQSSLINIFGTRGRGNTGTDLNAIPVSAIDRIEILRDGASAQYGSDAIAGVLNIVLKSSVGKFTGWVNSGVRKEGDGEMVQVNGNYGFETGNGGFVNVTLDYLHKGRTNRPADPVVYDVYRRKFGDAESDNFGAYFNAEMPLKGETKFYAFGGYNFRDTDAYAWTRGADEDRNVQAIYPNGFDPHILSNISDKSVSAGIKTDANGWKIDFNNTYGQNIFHYYVDGTLNASLLEKSPTYFDAGGFKLAQNTTGLHFSKYNEYMLAGSNIAFGAEYRVENYQIFAGEEASWKNYGIIDTVINNMVVPWDALQRPGGSQGFPGFRPDNEVDEFRTNIAGYIDFEVDFTSRFMLATAVRGERYSDFGTTINGKLASRFALSDRFAIRGSVSTGFRAPSLAQIYFNSVFTDFVSGVAVDKIIAQNNSPITRALGIPPLKQERALNFSAGFTAEPVSRLTLTVDGYFVDIQDRIVLTGAFEDTDPEIGSELQALNVGAAQFFTNAVDTRTTGVDIIVQYSTRMGRGDLKATMAANFNDMSIEDIKTNQKLAGKEDIYFGEREQYFLLASAPDSKINLTLDYTIDKFNINLRLVRFDEVILIDWLGTKDVYEAKISTDLALGYKFTDNIRLIVGGSNILDELPTRQDTETETGGLWDPVQMGFNGAFYFAKLGFTF